MKGVKIKREARLELPRHGRNPVKQKVGVTLELPVLPLSKEERAQIGMPWEKVVQETWGPIADKLVGYLHAIYVAPEATPLGLLILDEHITEALKELLAALKHAQQTRGDSPSPSVN